MLIKTTSGDITADEITLLGLKRVTRGVLQADGHSWLSTELVVGVARYKLGDEEREVEFDLSAANKLAIKTAAGAAAVAAIKAQEGVA